jgi:hypothetical protein
MAKENKTKENKTNRELKRELKLFSAIVDIYALSEQEAAEWLQVLKNRKLIDSWYGINDITFKVE